MDEELAKLFKQWLAAFEAMEAAIEEEAVAIREVLADVESRIAATPAEGLRGLVVKLGLHQFLKNQADAASIQVDARV
jgi:anti-sigma-K factor RskA